MGRDEHEGAACCDLCSAGFVSVRRRSGRPEGMVGYRDMAGRPVGHRCGLAAFGWNRCRRSGGTSCVALVVAWSNSAVFWFAGCAAALGPRW